MTPTGAASRSTTADGDTITANATGFLDDEQIDAVLHSDPIDLGTYTADADGNLSFAVTIPADLPLGEHHIDLTGLISGHSVSIESTVTGSVAAVMPVAGTAALASMGEPLDQSMTLIGLCALLVGVGLVSACAPNGVKSAALG
jgi:primary-amine oxidase